MKLTLRTFLMLTLMLQATPAVLSADDTSQTDNNYYWQGTQLYNLGRLGEAFESFEKAIQRKQNTKEAEQFLMKIRQEIVSTAKKRAEERTTLNFQGANNPNNALNISYIQKGYIKVNLQLKHLFQENSTAMKTSATEVLNKLAALLESKEGNRIEIVVVDELDNTPNAKEVNAERALSVFSYLNFKKSVPES